MELTVTFRAIQSGKGDCHFCIDSKLRCPIQWKYNFCETKETEDLFKFDCLLFFSMFSFKIFVKKVFMTFKSVFSAIKKFIILVKWRLGTDKHYRLKKSLKV